MLPIHAILHPTDFSERAGAAFRMACALARDHGARLVVLHVYPPPLSHGEVVARRQPNGFHEELWSALRRVQPREPGLNVEHWLIEGHAAAEILRAAAEHGCDLIVMGTHGRAGVARLLMGSVAEKVLRKAPCPVLTVKTPLLQEADRAEWHTEVAAHAG